MNFFLLWHWVVFGREDRFGLKDLQSQRGFTIFFVNCVLFWLIIFKNYHQNGWSRNAKLYKVFVRRNCRVSNVQGYFNFYYLWGTSRVINISHALVQCIQQVLFLLPRGHWRLDCLLPILINIIKIQSVLPLPT